MLANWQKGHSQHELYCHSEQILELQRGGEQRKHHRIVMIPPSQAWREAILTCCVKQSTTVVLSPGLLARAYSTHNLGSNLLGGQSNKQSLTLPPG